MYNVKTVIENGFDWMRDWFDEKEYKNVGKEKLFELMDDFRPTSKTLFENQIILSKKVNGCWIDMVITKN